MPQRGRRPPQSGSETPTTVQWRNGRGVLCHSSSIDQHPHILVKALTDAAGHETETGVRRCRHLIEARQREEKSQPSQDCCIDNVCVHEMPARSSQFLHYLSPLMQGFVLPTLFINRRTRSWWENRMILTSAPSRDSPRFT